MLEIIIVPAYALIINERDLMFILRGIHSQDPKSIKVKLYMEDSQLGKYGIKKNCEFLAFNTLEIK